MTDVWNLRQLHLFTGLTRNQIDQILQVVAVESFAPGEVLFRPGDTPDRLYFLQHGRVKTYVVSPEGQEHIRHVFFPGDAFGSLLLGSTREELPWAQALDDVVVSALNEGAFKRFVSTFPDLCVNLIRHMAAQHAADLRRLETLLHAKASHRRIRTMLELGDQLGQGDEPRFELGPTFTHELLANMVGVARTTVSGLISQLRRRGVLSGRGRYLIVHRRAAEQFLQAEEA